MRSALLSAILLSAATPAVAAPSDTQLDMERMASRLNDPATQSALSGGLMAMVGALLDMRVDGIAKAIEPLNGGKKVKLKGNTLREIGRRDDPRFEAKMENGSRAMIGGMGAMASAFAAALPQLEEAMEKMGDSLDRAKASLPEGN